MARKQMINCGLEENCATEGSEGTVAVSHGYVPRTVTTGDGRTLVGLDSMDSPDGASLMNLTFNLPQLVPGPFSLIIVASGIWEIVRAHYSVYAVTSLAPFRFLQRVSSVFNAHSPKRDSSSPTIFPCTLARHALCW
ncbi:hypothetical protein F1880_007356 [Penicillium rolfsii]|nr:hypothetical protein F1880_007356 [Penicillium rolfsii]